MCREKKIGIIGSVGIVGTRNMGICASSINITENDESNITENKILDSEPFLIKKLPMLKDKETWIDPKEPIFNYKKHKQTCDKNRKKRKKRKKK